MRLFDKFRRNIKSNRLSSAAAEAEAEHKYIEAAEDRSEEAKLALPDNELIFADECLYASKDYLLAGNPEEALNQARRALQGYMLSDWLKDEDYLKDLTDMVGQFHSHGYVKQSEELLADINKAIVSLGEKPVTLTVMGAENTFPDICPHCGGSINYRGPLEQIPCPFCAGTIHAL